jgi:hypothetical protein
MDVYFVWKERSGLSCASRGKGKVWLAYQNKKVGLLSRVEHREWRKVYESTRVARRKKSGG